MDVYHKVLMKIYEVTGGKDTQTFDLKDLVKNLGFLGNYNDISQLLNSKGWIAETRKLDTFKITHWGVKEAKQSQDGSFYNSPSLNNEANQLITKAKEFSILLEEFSSDTSEEKIQAIEKKLAELNYLVDKLKQKI